MTEHFQTLSAKLKQKACQKWLSRIFLAQHLAQCRFQRAQASICTFLVNHPGLLAGEIQTRFWLNTPCHDFKSVLG